MGGQPPASGEEPQDRDHGAADDGFATVAFDEAFVRAATIHEPSAAERIRAAAQARGEAAEADLEDDGHPDGPASPPRERYDPYELGFDDPVDDPVDDHFEERFEERFGDAPRLLDPCWDGPGRSLYRAGGPYRGHVRWQRPVAWVLAVVMGVGVVALAFSAVYRGVVSQRQTPAPPPATSDVERQPTPREAASP